MSKRAVGTAMMMVVLALSVSVVGCKSKAKLPPDYQPSNYATYVDDVTNEQFLVPKDVKVYPPIVNPKTGKRTLVRAHVYIPKGGGAPKAFWYEKFSDAQIKAMEEYAKTAKPEMLEEMPPDAWMSGQNEGPMLRRVDGKWMTFQDQMRYPGSMPSVRKEAKSFFEQTPDDWGEKLTEDQVKQW